MSEDQFVPNPNPYEWKGAECDAEGVPFVKKAGVVLEKNEKTADFLTQEAVDEAWAAGWHDTGRPETADVVTRSAGLAEVEGEDGSGGLTGPISEGKLNRMTKLELIEYGDKLDLNLDPDDDELTNSEMREAIRDEEAERFPEEYEEEEEEEE